MRTTLRFLLSAFVVGSCGLVATSPRAAAEDEKPNLTEEQRKEVIAKLEKMLKEVQELEARKKAELKKAEEAKRAAEGKKPAPPEPPKPGQPGGFGGMGGFGGPWGHHAALEALLRSPDPKVAALAKELLAQLKKQPATPGLGGGVPFKFEFSPTPGGEKPKAEATPGKPLQLELKFEGGKHLFMVVPEGPKPGGVGGSSMRMSADGKTAAVVGADGSITIFDVASGKEVMKFPAKK